MKEKITVRQASNPDQFIVENNHQEIEGDFLENYISFSGYFGKHGPYVFAAGPELVEALETIIDCYNCQGKLLDDQINSARAALAKARGEA